MKKLHGALLAFVMMFTLAGCGSSSAAGSKWERRGQFTDENLNYLSITDVTEMDLGEEYSGYHAAGMLDGIPYSGFTEFDGKALGKAGDAQANLYLCDALREARPEDGLLSEECKDSSQCKAGRLSCKREYSFLKLKHSIHPQMR